MTFQHHTLRGKFIVGFTPPPPLCNPPPGGLEGVGTGTDVRLMPPLWG